MLHLVPWGSLGGTEKHVLHLAAALGNDVTSVVAAPEGEATALFDAAGVSYRAINPLGASPSRVRGFLRGYRAILRELDEQGGISLLHVHAGVEYALAARLARKTPPIVFTIHGYPDSASYIASGFVANRIADEVICVSDSERRAAARLGFSPDKLTVVHHGIPRPHATPEAAAEFRARWGVPDSALVVGTVSRLKRPKGVDSLVRAFARLRATLPDAMLVVVGWGRESSALESLASDLGVRTAVAFTGPLADPAPALEAMDIFVLPSQREAFSLAILEAMALGKPVVATRVGGIPELVAHEDTGLLVPARDDEALAAALLELARDAEKRRRLGERGQARFEAHFSIDAMARRTLDVYERVLARRRPSEAPGSSLAGAPPPSR